MITRYFVLDAIILGRKEKLKIRELARLVIVRTGANLEKESQEDLY